MIILKLLCFVIRTRFYFIFFKNTSLWKYRPLERNCKLRCLQICKWITYLYLSRSIWIWSWAELGPTHPSGSYLEGGHQGNQNTCACIALLSTWPNQWVIEQSGGGAKYRDDSYIWICMSVDQSLWSARQRSALKSKAYWCIEFIETTGFQCWQRCSNKVLCKPMKTGSPQIVLPDSSSLFSTAFGGRAFWSKTSTRSSSPGAGCRARFNSSSRL